MGKPCSSYSGVRMHLSTLFHIHTTYTDGKSTLREYFEYAEARGIRKLIFLEHIRKQPTYDVFSFARSVKNYSEAYNASGIVGFEAKILPDGELDILDEHIKVADFVGIAEHSFKEGRRGLLSSFREVCGSYPQKYPTTQFVWVHPGLWFKKRNILHSSCHFKMLEIAGNCPVKIEVNLRYQLPQLESFSYFPVLKEKMIVGLDAHSVADINRLLTSQYASNILRFVK